MEIDLKPGAYVVAVSGGVDSMTLLHILQQLRIASGDHAWKLIIAHLDHGIREDSALDRKLVQKVAHTYGLPFVYDEAKLGAFTSEAVARARRYGFLRQVQQTINARSILTAHHEDDLFETAIINLMRGTGRKGITSLSKYRAGIERPLLNQPKAVLLAYAKEHCLEWREDSTNQDQTYLRNYIRHTISPRLDEVSKAQLRQIIRNLQDINDNLDTLLVNQLHIQSVGGMIDRQWFNHLPHNVAKELMATWLRAHGENNFNRKTLERLVVSAKVGRAGSAYSLSKMHSLRVGRDNLALAQPER